jgi:adhesin/invasin
MKQATRSLSRRLSRTLGCVSAVVYVAAGCGETSPSAVLPPAGLSVVGSSSITGTAGQTLAEPTTFQVVDANQQPMPGVTVTFEATGNGALANPASAVTDANGMVQTRWTLPVSGGSGILTARAGNASAQVVATVAAAPPGRVEAASVTAQGGVAGLPVTTAPSVRVLDAFGNPAAGAQVTFSVFGGGGSVTEFIRTTGSDGIATVGSWQLGPLAGAQTLLARVEAAGVTGNPVVFTAVALPGSPAQIAAASATSQTGTVSTAVSAPPAVVVRDAGGNPVQNASVSFAVTAGGGQVGSSTATTDAQGRASAGAWVLGPQAGTNTVTASVPGAGSVQFTAVATAGLATQFTMLAGNNQTAQVTRAVAVAPRVEARDAGGNPVPGVVVTFQVASGGGTVIAGRQVTDAAGVAEVGAWFLGSTPGQNTLTATAAGMPVLTFTATATPGQPATMSAASASAQTGTVGTDVAAPPAVVIRDAVNNPVPGVVVTFTVNTGGGTLTNAAGTTGTSVTVTTDANGRAAVSSWRLGTTLMQNSVTASAPGLPSVTFTASPAAGAPASVAGIAGLNTMAVQGTAVTPRPSVRVLDANGNVVAGARVEFTVQAGNGSITGASQTTDAAGVATVGSWVLGAAATNQLHATVVDSLGAALDIASNPVLFQGRAASAIEVWEAATPAARETQFQITVYLVDSAGQPVPLSGVPLTLEMSGTGTLTGSTLRSTNADGAAVFTLSLSGDAGPRTFTIYGAGLYPASVGITFN